MKLKLRKSNTIDPLLVKVRLLEKENIFLKEQNKKITEELLLKNKISSIQEHLNVLLYDKGKAQIGIETDRDCTITYTIRDITLSKNDNLIAGIGKGKGKGIIDTQKVSIGENALILIDVPITINVHT